MLAQVTFPHSGHNHNMRTARRSRWEGWIPADFLRCSPAALGHHCRNRIAYTAVMANGSLTNSIRAAFSALATTTTYPTWVTVQRHPTVKHKPCHQLNTYQYQQVTTGSCSEIWPSCTTHNKPTSDVQKNDDDRKEKARATTTPLAKDPTTDQAHQVIRQQFAGTLATIHSAQCAWKTFIKVSLFTA